MDSKFVFINKNGISEFESFLISLIFGFWFLNFEAFIRIKNLYAYFPPVDIPSHLFSGLALGIGFYWVVRMVSRKKSIVLPIILTFGVAVSWEILENIDDLLIPQSLHYMDYFIWDGFFDIIFTTFGGFVVLIFVSRNFNIIKSKKYNYLEKKHLNKSNNQPAKNI